MELPQNKFKRALKDGKRCLDMGYLFVAVGADVGMLARGADALAAKFKS